MTRPTILITGATGNVGRALLPLLSTADVTLLAGSTGGQAVDGVPGRKVDFTDPEGLKQAFAGVDRLFLLLPLGPGMVQMARNAIAAAAAAGVSFVLRSSGAGADPQAGVSIGRIQGEIDALLPGAGPAWSIIRPSFFMQNWAVYSADMVRQGALYAAHGDGKAAYIDVADIAATAAAILLNPQAHDGKTYDLTGPEAVSAAEIAGIFSETLGRPVKYVPTEDAAVEQSLRAMGADDWRVDIVSGLNLVIRNNWAAETSPAVEQITGTAPRSFRQFAAENRTLWQ